MRKISRRKWSSETNPGSLAVMLWPIVFELIFTGIIANANQLILNRFSLRAVAATTTAGQFLTLTVTMYSIFSVGQSILIAPCWGAGKYREGSKILLSSLADNCLFALILSVLGVLGIPTVLRLMNVPENLCEMAREYLLVAVGLSLFQAVTTTLTAALRAMGRMKAVMAGNLLINGSCVGLNFLILTLVPRSSQSITQYALAGICSQILGGLFFFAVLLRDEHVVFRIPGREFQSSFWENTRKIAGLGLFGGMEGIIYLISQTAVVSMIGILGTQALTAKGYAGNLIVYMSLPANAVPLAAATLVGMAAGRHREEDMHRIFSKCLRVSLLLTLCTCGVSLLISSRFLQLYTKEPELLSLCLQVLAVDGAVELARCFAALLVISLKAIGDVKLPFRMVIVGSILNLAVSWGCGIGLGMGLLGIWLGYGADLAFRSVVGMWCWRKHKREHRYPIWE